MNVTKAYFNMKYKLSWQVWKIQFMWPVID